MDLFGGLCHSTPPPLVNNCDADAVAADIDAVAADVDDVVLLWFIFFFLLLLLRFGVVDLWLAVEKQEVSENRPELVKLSTASLLNGFNDVKGNDL